MKVYLVGAGPGDPGLLSLRALEILANADVVIYDALANETLLDLSPAYAEHIYVGKVASQHSLSQSDINALLVRKAREGKVVVRLKGGDPYIFGRGAEEAQALRVAGIDFETIPGISSTIAAPAYAGIPLTHRDWTSSVTFITGHENPDKGESVHNWKAFVDSKSTLVFVMGMQNIENITKNLLEAGMEADMPAAVIYRGTTPKQRSIVCSVAELATKSAEAGLTNPAVIVVGKVCNLHTELDWFSKRSLFGRSIVITRAREQASELAKQLDLLGAEVIQCPSIAIKPLAKYATLDAAIVHLSRYEWVIFTSTNGVAFFWQRLDSLGLDSRALGGCKVAAIGPATAQSLKERGIHADIVPGYYQAEGLIESFLAWGPLEGVRMLLPRASKAREILPEELRNAGASVDVISAYDTVPDTSKIEEITTRLEEKTLDCIVFASSSTVENLVNLIPPEKIRDANVRLAAIGPITAATLDKYGLKCDIQPTQFTIPALIDAVVQFYSPKIEHETKIEQE